MFPPQHHPVSPWLKPICTYNPFYLISACLVLYGIHVSFAGDANLSNGWLLMRLLSGYAALLVGSSVLVVRFGRVWEDARTILLIAVLVFIAQSACFDKFCLDDPPTGAHFLGAGLLMVVLLTETAIRSLGLRFPFHYRVAYYSQFVLLFAYPVWLAYLSVSDQEPLMSWYVQLFPVFAGTTLLTLIPAAMRGGRGDRPSGTPWKWPAYPWPVFVFLLVGMSIRAYSLSVSFELAGGLVAGFQWYFLIPILLPAILLVTEILRTLRLLPWTWITTCAALGLLTLAFPGTAGNSAQAYHISILLAHFVSPALIACLLLVVYYGYCWFRGVTTAEYGLIAVLVCASFIDHNTISLQTSAPPQQHVIVVLFWLLCVRSYLLRNSVYLLAAILLGVADASYVLRDTWWISSYGYYPLHLTAFLTLALGLLFRDRMGTRIREAAPTMIGVFAVGTGTLYPFLFGRIPFPVHLLWISALLLLASSYWYLNRAPRFLITIMVCLWSGTILCFIECYRYLRHGMELKGHLWLALGLLSLVAAVVISLIKGGLTVRLQRGMRRLNALLKDSVEPR